MLLWKIDCNVIEETFEMSKSLYIQFLKSTSLFLQVDLGSNIDVILRVFHPNKLLI